MEASKLNDGGDESSVLQKSESLPVTSSQFRSPNRFLQFIQNILIILNCLLIISIFGMSQQMIRYQSIIGFSIFHFGSIIIIAFALSINIILKLFEGIIDKSNYFRILINTISIILSVLIASNIKYQWIPINSNNVADEVRTNFLKILESNNDLTLLHQFQNEFQCCGVRLADDPTFVWNQTTIALSNPWSFWFYTFVPGDQYIFDVRRLFSLPWSCCRNMMRCEHLGIERFSLQFPDSIASSSSVFDEVESIDRLLGTRIISDVVTSIYEPSCQEKGREIVDGSMRILMIQLYVQAAFSTFFAFTNLLFKFGV